MNRGEVAAGRRRGMRPAKREEVAAANNKLLWYAVCRNCKTFMKGTPDDIRAHRCNDSTDRPPQPTA